MIDLFVKESGELFWVHIQWGEPFEYMSSHPAHLWVLWTLIY